MSNVENNNEYSIIFSGVKKAYGKTVVIENLNLEIKKGERLILLGPSGCGKTTTLRMIAGFEEITSGDLFMEGMRHYGLTKDDFPRLFKDGYT